METLLVWFTQLSPWIQGLFGGVGVTIPWEGLIKPSRERRSLAHVLAEEVAFNLEYTAGQRIYLETHPVQLPGDFRCSTVVFAAVASRLGELPEFVRQIVVLYSGLEALNDLPRAYGDALERRAAASMAKEGLKELPAIEKELNLIMGVYRSGLEAAVDRTNNLLPFLRRASVAWYAVDVWPRRPRRYLDLKELAGRVHRLAAQRDAEAKGA